VHLTKRARVNLGRLASAMSMLMSVAYSAGSLVVESTARSFGFELQGSCPTFASWCASKRDP
jgi:hypothetical protein